MISDYIEIGRIKTAIRDRDGWVCLDCGMTQAESVAQFGCGLEVHRVIHLSEYSLSPGACRTLCKRCHAPHTRVESPTVNKPARNTAKVDLPIDPETRRRAEAQAMRFGETLSSYIRRALIKQTEADELSAPPKPKPPR